MKRSASLVELGFVFGDEVYLKCDAENRKGIVTGFLHRVTGYIVCIAWGDRTETNHFPYEITKEKDFTTT